MIAINELLDKPDNAEKIRDAIACILKAELENQYTLASTSGAQDVEDFNFKVFMERSRPFDFSGNVFHPTVNILLPELGEREGKAGSNIGNHDYTLTFNLDCYGFGNAEDDDTQSVLKAWKVARVVRNILMSEQYVYLGMRSIVRRRQVSAIKTGVPDNIENSAIAVSIARIFFEVDTYEGAPEEDAVDFDGIYFVALSERGEVLIDM